MAEKPLLAALTIHFDLEELRTLCFDLDVPYDDLRGEGRQAKARELILYLQRRGRLPHLVKAVVERRPEAAEVLRGASLPELALPDGLAAGWWQEFRRSPPVLQVLLGLVAAAGLVLLGVAVYQGAQSVFPRNPWGPDVTPAQPSENLILISGFRGPPAGDLLPEQRIAAALRELIANRRDVEARIELVTRRQIADEGDATAWGQTHGAQLVIWGWYDADRVQVNLTLPETVNIRPVGEMQPVERSAASASWQLNQALPERVELASLIALGWVSYVSNKYDTAAQLWDSVIAKTNSYSTADQRALQIDSLLVLRGTVAELDSEPQVAQAAYGQAAQINPQNLLAAYNGGRLALEAGDPAQAISETRKVIGATPSPPAELLTAALNLAAQAHAELGQLDAAAEAAERAVSAAPIDSLRAEALTTLSDIYLRRREWERAVNAGQRAIALAPDDPIPCFNLGRAYLHIGQVAEAEKAYRNAVARTKPPDREILDGAMDELQQDAAAYPELSTDIERMQVIIRETTK
jgi:tetratricopeptide (TPR) repeat protein